MAPTPAQRKMHCCSFKKHTNIIIITMHIHCSGTRTAEDGVYVKKILWKKKRTRYLTTYIICVCYGVLHIAYGHNIMFKRLEKYVSTIVNSIRC